MAHKVIVIDDDLIIRKSLKKFLEELSFDVTVIEDGKSIMELLEKIKPDLLISDILVPGTNGIDICKKIKNDPELSHIKVLLMSSLYKRSDTVQDDLKCKYDAFLEKPIEFSSLKVIIQNLNISGIK